MEKARASKKQTGLLSDCLRATLIAALISALCVLILAIIAKFASIGDKILLPINQVVKVLALLAGCLLGFKSAANGLLKGAFVGVLFALVSFVSVAASAKSLAFSVFSFWDLTACVIAGAVAGVIAVNVKNRK